MLSMPRIVRPDPSAFRGWKLVPPLDRLLADPFSETKNWWNLLAGKSGRQVSPEELRFELRNRHLLI
jgi:hypothetical protein